jgi:hypothetical protein
MMKMINVKTWLANTDDIAKGITNPTRRGNMKAQCDEFARWVNGSAEMNVLQAAQLEKVIVHAADIRIDPFQQIMIAGVINGFHA